MAVAAPERSLEQRRVALRRANAIRVYRAALKRRLTTELAIEVLTSPPSEVATMSVYSFLLALPRWGTAKVRQTLRLQRISDVKTVGGLSDRQRRELIAVLSESNDRRRKPTLTGAPGGRQEES